MFVAEPMVDGVTEAIEPAFLNGLAKGEVGFPPVSAEFHDEAGLGDRNEIAREGEVT
jgi:hypothetical protein